MRVGAHALAEGEGSMRIGAVFEGVAVARLSAAFAQGGAASGVWAGGRVFEFRGIRFENSRGGRF
jgi:hypothetical protein